MYRAVKRLILTAKKEPVLWWLSLVSCGYFKRCGYYDYQHRMGILKIPIDIEGSSSKTTFQDWLRNSDNRIIATTNMGNIHIVVVFVRSGKLAIDYLKLLSKEQQSPTGGEEAEAQPPHITQHSANEYEWDKSMDVNITAIIPNDPPVPALQKTVIRMIDWKVGNSTAPSPIKEASIESAARGAGSSRLYLISLCLHKGGEVNDAKNV
ncbi:hypothetical protein BKA61DRAFT_571539 [Leptodontidium sp. MPI-SDFR-AT-0119]|nr:hypothetical protein BKA61DRAFT_571539 [Leptodontidium sp. MPI-SDFR-AT-0119]